MQLQIRDIYYGGGTAGNVFRENMNKRSSNNNNNNDNCSNSRGGRVNNYDTNHSRYQQEGIDRSYLFLNPNKGR